MQDNKLSETRTITIPERMAKSEVKEILANVFNALNDKGYNPLNQIVGYILSGDPTYITSHKDARSLITKLERDELLEEIVWYYLKGTE
ncbi:MAG: IreB family regulatory phosphoprotein [Defluviitaleaceae bacterium]|nr:IreB family regulatory phosphoprotein [Defluviitaleaceae bacterium]